MPCTQNEEQDQTNYPNHSFRSTFNRAFVGLRMTDSQHQNMPSYSIVTPSIEDQHHRSPNQQQYQQMAHLYNTRQPNQVHQHQNYLRFANSSQPSQHHNRHNHQDSAHSSTAIPREIVTVADDLTEQIRISVQDTHLGPRGYINDIDTGGNISDVTYDYDSTEDYRPNQARYGASSAGVVVAAREAVAIGRYENGADQANYLHQMPTAPNNLVGDEHELMDVQGSSNSQSYNDGAPTLLNHHTDQTTSSNAIVTSGNHATTINSIQSRTGQSESSSQTYQQQNETQTPQTSTSYDASFLSDPNSSSNFVVHTRGTNCKNSDKLDCIANLDILPKGNRRNISRSGTALTSQVIYTNSYGDCKGSNSAASGDCNEFSRESRQENPCNQGAQKTDVSNDQSSTLDSEHREANNSLEEPNQKFSYLSLIPPFSSHRQAGFIKTNLYNGACFNGYQRSRNESYEVNVKIQHVDFANSYICGYLCINHLTKTHPSLTTFFGGEIISKKYPFLTRKWDANEKIDKTHWSKFEGFDEKIAGTFNSDTFNYDDLANSDYVFMRWKEHFLVPDHKIKFVEGASYDGFYYICYSKRTSEIRGYYFHINTRDFESFQSLDLEYDYQGSSQVYEFR